VQDYQPRIRLRLDDAVTVLITIEHVDNQQLGNFSQKNLENIVVYVLGTLSFFAIVARSVLRQSYPTMRLVYAS
jgi:hypothetical protein